MLPSTVLPVYVAIEATSPPRIERAPSATVMTVVPPPADVQELVLQEDPSVLPAKSSKKSAASRGPTKSEVVPLLLPAAKSSPLCSHVLLVVKDQEVVAMLFPTKSFAPLSVTV